MRYTYFDLLVDVQAIILQAEKDMGLADNVNDASYSGGRYDAAKEIKKLIEEVNK